MCNIWNTRVTRMLHANYHNAHHSTHLSPVAHADQMPYPCYQCVKHVTRVLQHTFSMCNKWNTRVTRMFHVNYHHAHHSTHTLIFHMLRMRNKCVSRVSHTQGSSVDISFYAGTRGRYCREGNASTTERDFFFFFPQNSTGRMLNRPTLL